MIDWRAELKAVALMLAIMTGVFVVGMALAAALAAWAVNAGWLGID